jgi:hypothetical protein
MSTMPYPGATPVRTPKAFGGTGPNDDLWKINVKELPSGLIYFQDKDNHGYIMPAYAMPYLEYKKLLESTQSMWIQEPKPK